MPCSVCAHPEAAAIAAAVARGESFRTVAEQYGVSKSALSRHLSHCPSSVPAAPQAGAAAPSMGERSAPAYVVNPQVHQEAMRLYNVLVNKRNTVDVRQGLVVLAYLMAQVVRDAGESAPQADETATRWHRL